MKKKPLLSIITVNLNNLDGLKKTMQSVFAQTFTDYEYIIIDGGSTDGSKEFIEQNSARLTHWISEKDDGIYDALNKGSRLAFGQYIHHLNSGDTYLNDNSLKDLLAREWTEDFIYSDQKLANSFVKNYPPQLTLGFFMKDAVPHQATIIKRTLFERTGPFSNDYSMGGDYKFFIEAVFMHQCTYAHSNIVLVKYDMEGISSLNNVELRGQFEDIRQKSLPNLISEFESLYETKRQFELLQKSRGVQLINRIKRLIAR